MNIQKHFRRKFYDETHHTFYNALRTQKNQYKLNECNCLDDMYIQKQKNKPQVVMSYMVCKPNGMLNVVINSHVIVLILSLHMNFNISS